MQILGTSLNKVSREETFKKCHKLSQNIANQFSNLESFPNLLTLHLTVQPQCFSGENNYRVVQLGDFHDLRWRLRII